MKDLYNLKVAKVVDDFTIVLNAGQNDGAEVGMQFVVYQLGERILDPDTEELLGQLETVKGNVEIFHVQDRLSIAKSSRFVTRRVPTTPTSLMILRGQSETNFEDKRVRLRLEGVEVGDLARRTS